MSLIITSSRQQEFDGTPGALQGIENPTSYKNHMKSPLMLKPNSEVAVVSVRVDRKDVIVVDRGERMALYWGTEPDGAGGMPSWIQDPQPHLPVYLEVPDGSYNQNEFAVALETALTDMCQKTYSNVSEVTVNLKVQPAEEFATYEIKFFALANASTVGLSSLTAADWLSCVNDSNKTPSEIEIRRAYGEGPYDKTDDFTPTAGTGKIVMGSGGGDGKACAILKNKVLSSTSGVCEFSFDGYNNNFTVGLVRNIASDRAAPARFNSEFQSPNFAGQDGNKISQFFDYALTLKRSAKGAPTSWGLTQSVVINETGSPIEFDTYMGTQMVRVPNASLVVSPGNASFDNSGGSGDFFNKVRFTRYGEGIRVDLIDNKGVVTNIVSQLASSALKPCGDSSDLLYAKIFMDGDPGDSLEITQFDVCDYGTKPRASQPYDTKQRRYGYDLGNNTDEFASVYQQYQDEYTMGGDGAGSVTTSTGFADNTFISAPIYALMNGSGGQDREWGMVLGPDDLLSIPDGYDQEIPTVEVMIPNDNMRKRLGFAEMVVLEIEDATAGAGTLTVTFEGNRAIETTHGKNMFIRWHPTQQVSYNANQGSISKIVYACPRFDVNGSVAGALYFEPNERVYVDCNNVDELMITDIGVDIVDINEMLVTDLIGTTQINFHVRQKEGFSVGRDSGRT